VISLNKKVSIIHKKNNMKKLKIIIILLISLQFLVGCKTMNNAQKGTAIGVGGGAVLGALVGKWAGNTAAGAIIGAAVGGTAGVLIGKYMDKQVAELQADLEDAKVERVGEGIKITFNSGILFDLNSSNLGGVAKDNIGKLAVVLNKYADTDVLIEGHTDITGSVDYNQTLSEKRAASVSNFLSANAVQTTRLTTIGYGPNQPLVDNDTPANRSLNRRVEIAIYANDKLKKAAEKGQIGNIE
jgi:outer membrane protein OmpA-like peptidoglycan-associated protein